jgi:hypothetical protein
MSQATFLIVHIPQGVTQDWLAGHNTERNWIC